MPLYFCTPRGDVHLAPPEGQALRYVEEVPELERDTHPGYWMRGSLRPYDVYHVKPWGSLPMREAPYIEMARVDFMFDQATKDVLDDIRRTFRGSFDNRFALERRRQREEYRKKHGW